MRMLGFTLTMAAAWLIAGTAIGGEACKAPAPCNEVQVCGGQHQCGCCGRCDCACERQCRVVCEMREVKKTVWVVKCEEFCAPLPSFRWGCRAGCDDCAAQAVEAACCNDGGKRCDPCAREESKRVVPPKCAKVHERKFLRRRKSSARCRPTSASWCIVARRAGQAASAAANRRLLRRRLM